MKTIGSWIGPARVMANVLLDLGADSSVSAAGNHEFTLTGAPVQEFMHMPWELDEYDFVEVSSGTVYYQHGEARSDLVKHLFSFDNSLKVSIGFPIRRP